MALPTLLTRSKYSCDFLIVQSHSRRPSLRNKFPFGISRPIVSTGNELIEIRDGPIRSEISALRLASFQRPRRYLAMILRNFSDRRRKLGNPDTSENQLNRYGLPPSST